MKMNKRLFIALVASAFALVSMVAFTGCSKKGGSTSSTKTAKAPGKANPASDFKYDLTSDGKGVIINGIKDGFTGKTIVVPATIENYPVVEIGAKAFSAGNFSPDIPITSVYLPDTITAFGVNDDGSSDVNQFTGNKALVSVNIPPKVTKLPRCIFSDCSALSTIIIPEGVTEIGEQAFQNCSSLTEVKIPDSVTTIGSRAFEGCTKLANVTVPAHTIKYPEAQYLPGNNAFDGTALGTAPLSVRKAIQDSGYKDGF
jgi:hypothetical protein